MSTCQIDTALIDGGDRGALLSVPKAAGTVVHLLHSFAPGRVIHGIEIDSAVVAASREFLGLKALEDSGHLVRPHRLHD